jgi:hypothetical protein
MKVYSNAFAFFSIPMLFIGIIGTCPDAVYRGGRVYGFVISGFEPTASALFVIFT